MQIDKNWYVVFIKPEGNKYESAAILPTLTMARVWLSKNYQGDHKIIQIPLTFTVPDVELEDDPSPGVAV